MTRFNNSEAVSPVVGVMLMLVVTIIIAAAVSGFASGLTGSVDMPSQVSLKGTYSQSSGMTITHAGGDPLPLADIKFSTCPSELFGQDYLKFEYDIDPCAFNYTKGGESTAIMDNATGYYYKSSILPGETITISRKNVLDKPVTAEQKAAFKASTKQSPYSTGGYVNVKSQMNWPTDDPSKEEYYGSYQFMNPDNIGKYFYLIVRDGSGNEISRTKVTITA